MTLRYLSVCSGIEAASVAWAPLGWEPVLFSEIERFPRAVLRHRLNARDARRGILPGQVPMWGDFTTIRPRHLKRLGINADIDLLVGGTPCQSFSIAGLRGGLDDPRGDLALGFLELARRLRPRWVVWENVPGVLSSNGGRDFGAFLGGLAELGYGFAYRVLDAQNFGVPQRRRRVFVVAHLGDWRRAAAVLFERHSLSGHPAPRREAGEGVATRAGGGAAFGGGNCSGEIPVATTLTAPVRRQDFEAEAFVAHTLRGEGFDASEDGTGRGTPLVPVLPFDTTQITSAGNYSRPKPGDPCHPLAAGSHPPAIAFSCKDYGADAGATAPTLRAMGHDGSHANAGGQVAVMFQERGRADGRSLDIGGDVAYALTAPDGGGRAQERNVLTPGMAVRRLTPRECERLQGFPDDFTLVPYGRKPAEQCPDGPRYRVLGNSMAVPAMRWIGERIEMIENVDLSQRKAA